MWRFSVLSVVVVLVAAQFALSECSPDRHPDFAHGRSLKKTGVCPSGKCDSGESTSEWQFPFLAIVKDGSGRAVCSGSLIHKNVVLTAAHCVDILENPQVELGVFGTTGRFESFRTKGKIVHPDFDHHHEQVLHKADVGLLVLDRPAKTQPVGLTDFAHPGCFKKERCMQVNLPTFWESPKGSGRYSIKSQKVISHAWDQCWSLLTTEHRNKDSAICLSGIQENTVSCTGAGGPMMSASWQQTGIMSFKNGCTNTNAKTAHTLITPEIKTWIDGQVKEIEKGRTAGKTNGAVIAPAYCIFRNGFWFGGSDCKKLPKPKQEKGCYFFHGTWFGSKCPQKGQQKKKQGESQEKEKEPKMRGPEKECAFLFGKWIGKNCKKLSTLPKKKAGCIFRHGKWIGAGC